MKKHSKFFQPVINSLIVTSIFLLWGCTSSPSKFTLERPVGSARLIDENIRDIVKNVAVVYRKSSLEMSHPVPAQGAAGGAWEGAKEGFSAGYSAAAHVGARTAGRGFVLLIFTVPTGIVIGSLTGAADAPSKGDVEKTQEVLKNKLVNLKLPETLIQSTVEAANNYFPGNFKSLGIQEGSFSEIEKGLEGGLDEKPDAILSIEITEAGLWNFSETLYGAPIDPPLFTFLTIKSKLIGTKDDVLYHNLTLRCIGQSQEFTEWSRNDAELFANDLENCTRQLAETFVEKLFLTYPLSKKEFHRVSNGTGLSNQEPGD